MTIQFRSRQRGISFIGLVFTASVLAMAGVIAAQIFPTLVEYQAVTKAVKRAATGSSVSEVRMLFDKQAAVDDIKSISGKELEVTKEGDLVVVNFAYEREIHLTGPAFLVLRYKGASK